MRLQVNVPLGFTFETRALSRWLGISEAEVVSLQEAGQLVGRLERLNILDLLTISNGRFAVDLTDEEIEDFRTQLGFAPRGEQG